MRKTMLVALAVLALHAPARADLIFDNFTGLGSLVGYGIDWNQGWLGQGWAQWFEVPEGPGHTLFSVSLVLAPAGGPYTPNLHVWLAADNGGEPDSTAIETLVVDPDITAKNLYTFNSSAQPLLQGGSTYWIVVEPHILNWTNADSNVGYGWHLANNATATGAWFRNYSWDQHTWSNWENLVLWGQPSLRIEATAIPEPGVASLLFLGLFAFAWRRLAGR